MNISSRDKAILESIIGKYKKDFDFYAFGSRVQGTNTEFSDLDIAVVSKSNIPISVLRDEFEESDISIKIDLVDYHTISTSFKKIIEAKMMVI